MKHSRQQALSTQRLRLINTFNSQKDQHKDDPLWAFWMTAQLEEIDQHLSKPQVGKVVALHR